MANYTEEQISELIQFIIGAETPESVTNGAVGNVLDTLMQWMQAAKSQASSAASAAADNVIDEVEVTRSDGHVNISVKQVGRPAKSDEIPTATPLAPGVMTAEQASNLASLINQHTGKVPQGMAPATVLASMGSTLDNIGAAPDQQVGYVTRAGDSYFDTNSNTIKYVVSKNGNQDVLQDLGEPNPNIVYTNRFTGLCYRWQGAANGWKQVAGNPTRISNSPMAGQDDEALSAALGSLFMSKSRMVIDDMEHDSSDPPALSEVGDEGLLCFDGTMLYYYFANGEEVSGNETGVSCLEFSPDPHVLYCDGENGRVMKWDGFEFVTVSGGGGMSMQISGTKLIFTQSQGGGDIDITPFVSASPASINLGDIESGGTKSATFVVIGKNLTDDVIISSEIQNLLFSVGGSTPASSLSLIPDANGKLNGRSGYTITVIYTAGTVNENTPFSASIDIESDGAESKSIEVSGRAVPEIVPMLYLEENDETNTTGTTDLYAPLADTAANLLDSDVVGDYGVTKSVRVYTKNIDGVVTASLRDDTTNETDSTEFSLDDIKDSAEEPTRVTSKDYAITEDGYIDIPVRLPKQAEAGTITNQINVVFTYTKDGQERTAQATIALSGNIAARKTYDSEIGAQLILDDQVSGLAYYTHSAGTRVSKGTSWNNVFPSNALGDLVFPSRITDVYGYNYMPYLVYNYEWKDNTRIRSLMLNNVRCSTYAGSFSGCTNLKVIYDGGYIINKPNQAYQNCSNLKVVFYSGVITNSGFFSGCNKLLHVVDKGISNGSPQSSEAFPSITLTADDVSNYNSVNNLSEGDVGSLISSAYATEHGVVADEGKRYYGHRIEVNGLSVPEFTTLHHDGRATNSKLDQYFKLIESNADTFRYDVETDTIYYEQENN